MGFTTNLLVILKTLVDPVIYAARMSDIQVREVCILHNKTENTHDIIKYLFVMSVFNKFYSEIFYLKQYNNGDGSGFIWILDFPAGFEENALRHPNEILQVLCPSRSSNTKRPRVLSQ